MGATFLGGFNATLGGPMPTPETTQGDYFWIVTGTGDVNGVTYHKGSLVEYKGSTTSYIQYPAPSFYDLQGKSDEATRWADWSEVSNKPDTLIQKDAEGDIEVRMLRSSYPTQSAIPVGSAMAFRVNSGSDNFNRYADHDAILEFLGTVKDSALLSGKTLDAIKMETRRDLVPNTLTVNKKPLDAPVEINAADVGLGNVPNYAATSSPVGASTTLLATQRCSYEASAAPRLADERKRPIFYTENAPASDAPDGIYVLFNKSARTFTMTIKHEGVVYAAA